MGLHNQRHWWRVAAATAGLGAAIGSGQAVAWATPEDSGQSQADSASSTSSTSAASSPTKNDNAPKADRQHRPQRPDLLDRPHLRRAQQAAEKAAERAAEKAAERRQMRREAATKVAAELKSGMRRDLAEVRATLSDAEAFARKRPLRTLIGALPVVDHAAEVGRRNAIVDVDPPSPDSTTESPEATTTAAAETATAPTETITEAPPERITDAATAASFLNSQAATLGAPEGFATADNVKVQQVGTSDGFSETVYRVAHQRDGIEVLGSEVIVVTDPAGVVTSVVDNYDSRVDTMDLTLSRDLTTGTGAAAAALAAYVGSANPRPYRLIAGPMIAAGIVTPELVIDALDNDAEPQLVWRVSIDPPDATALTGRNDPGSTYYIRANGTETGTVVREVSNAQALTIGGAASTSARDVLGQLRDINIARLNLIAFNIDSLADTVRGITTNRTLFLLCIGPPITPGFPEFRGLFGWDSSAVSAHANIAEAYDYFETVLGRDSFDDDGAGVVVNVGYNPRLSFTDYIAGYSNAFWDPDKQQLNFGDVDDFEAALDIVGHEYVHAVVSHVVGDGGSVLDYGESGALNEAYADLLGLLIEDKSGTDRWLIGEDTSRSSGPLRNLADPTSVVTAYGEYRAHYADRYTGNDDDGGEHINSTIFSHAGYLMMTDPATAGVTDERWAQLYYHSLYKLSQGATFGEGRAAIVATAQDMGFSAAEIAAIEQAFDEVGIASAGNVLNL